MRVYEASEFFKIPKRVIQHFHKRRLISDPLTDNDMSNLSFFRYVWRDKVVLKSALARYSKERRKHIVETAGFTKPEAYVYTRHKNSDRRLPTVQLVDELSHYYKLPKGVAIKVVRKMKRKVYKMREKEKKNRKLGLDR